MKIKTKLYASAIVSIGLLSILTISLFIFSFKVNAEQIKVHLADTFTKAITSVIILSHEYTTFQSERTERQLDKKIKSLGIVIKESEGQIPLEIIRNAFKSLNNSYTHLRSVYKERKALLRKNESQAEIERTIYLEEALNTLLSAESNKIMATASQIYTEARKKTTALQRQGNWVITLFSFLLIAVIGITTLLIAKVITMQLTVLKKSADNIGAGDLYTVIPDLGGDEFGDLSNAFESMRLSRQQAEEALQKAHNELESRVQERTAELESINERMKGEIEERKKAEEEKEKLITDLQTAFAEVKTLRGILPLCSHCKKIRDDKGYWEKVDVYIYKHSQADISHSICPDCAKEHYPDLDIYD